MAGRPDLVREAEQLAGPCTGGNDDVIALNLPTEALILEGMRRMRSWSAIFRGIGADLDSIPMPTGNQEPLLKVELSEDEQELVARVRALMRRSARASTQTPMLSLGSIVMDLARHVVMDAGREVKLTAKEFLLLQYLLEHRGRVLSRDLLLGDVWGYRYTGGTRTVDVHVRRLREKLPALVDALVTVKQFGYKLADAGTP